MSRLFSKKLFSKQNFNSRAFISLSIFLSFLLLTITSVLMFVNQHTSMVSLLHTIMGFTLILVALWHLKNNLKPLTQYLHWRKRARRQHHT